MKTVHLDNPNHMAKRFSNKTGLGNDASSSAPDSDDFLSKLISWTLTSGAWVALLLAMVAFWVYRSSLTSDFVYDARKEILEEGFITSISNLPAVLSLNVLSMNLMLGSRPGQMLYLMLNAVLWGKEPFGYHLSSNLLHATNVALLFLLMLRLANTEITGPAKHSTAKVQIAAAMVALIFALHPIAVESVAEVSYSSSLLVTFFTLSALFAATIFRPESLRVAILMGSVGVFSAFAAVTCKESGIAVALILIAYWFLFRRNELKLPWILFLSAATLITAAFLTARFLFPPPPSPTQVNYLGGSFAHVFWVQPRLWVFMLGKLLWPVQLSADYQMEDLSWISSSVALAILVIVGLLQAWLASKSRLGALGIAVYWLGLVAVSNFVPLYHPLADRYYYLPLVGLAMQLLALLLMTLRWVAGFWVMVASLAIVLLPLTFTTLTREDVFASNLALWGDTVQVSPRSETAHYGFGAALLQRGKWDEAIGQFQKALDIDPNDFEAHNNLGIALSQKGHLTEAIEEFQQALRLNTGSADAHYNFGVALFQKGQVDDAITQFQAALRLKPGDIDAQDKLAEAKTKANQK